MAEPIKIKIHLSTFATNVFELRSVVKGKLYKRQYVGYTKKQAVDLFQKWINEKMR